VFIVLMVLPDVPDANAGKILNERLWQGNTMPAGKVNEFTPARAVSMRPAPPSRLAVQILFGPQDTTARFRVDAGTVPVKSAVAQPYSE